MRGGGEGAVQLGVNILHVQRCSHVAALSLSHLTGLSGREREVRTEYSAIDDMYMYMYIYMV